MDRREGTIADLDVDVRVAAHRRQDAGRHELAEVRLGRGLAGLDELRHEVGLPSPEPTAVQVARTGAAKGRRSVDPCSTSRSRTCWLITPGRRRGPSAPCVTSAAPCSMSRQRGADGGEANRATVDGTGQC